jgi:hypothetical protein
MISTRLPGRSCAEPVEASKQQMGQSSRYVAALLLDGRTLLDILFQ